MTNQYPNLPHLSMPSPPANSLSPRGVVEPAGTTMSSSSSSSSSTKDNKQKQPKSSSSSPPRIKKEFGEMVSIHKPDLRAMDRNSIRRISLTADDAEYDTNSDDENDNTGTDNNRNRRRIRNNSNLNSVLIPELPSHVPTPKTIETNDEPWAYKVEDAIYHIQNIFSPNHEIENYSNKHNDQNRGTPIKYATSSITPPESPVSSSKKTTKLLLTPTTSTSSLTSTSTSTLTSTTKWGPDFWNFQKNRNNSITLSPSSAEGLDESSSSNNNNNSSNNNTKTRGGIFSKRKSSKPKTKSPSNNSVDLATQEALMKDAMAQWKARKQQQQDTSTSTNNNTDKKTNTKATTGKTRSGDTSTATVPDDPSSSLLPPKRPYSPRSTVGNDVLAKKACDEAVGNGNGASNSSTQTNADADGAAGGSPPASRTGGAGISPRSIATTTKQKQPPTPLQMKWMLENALNLHAICHKDSFRI